MKKRRSSMNPLAFSPVGVVQFGQANGLGRRYAGSGDKAALASAVELLASCKSLQEASNLKWWWNEGVRSFAANAEELRAFNEALLERFSELFPHSALAV